MYISTFKSQQDLKNLAIIDTLPHLPKTIQIGFFCKIILFLISNYTSLYFFLFFFSELNPLKKKTIKNDYLNINISHYYPSSYLSVSFFSSSNHFIPENRTIFAKPNNFYPYNFLMQKQVALSYSHLVSNSLLFRKTFPILEILIQCNT